MGEVGEERRLAPQKSVVREAFRRGWPSVCDWVPKRELRSLRRGNLVAVDHLDFGDVGEMVSQIGRW